ncbi:hypothetical protein IW261DRAFT_1441209 [Armillaria novae-zelandiae]|uniref:Uncharacterized protein n=1 Tax=Armillaria novae-zelandiae TaxID=153914 RepID=A0AA39UIB0_9AGAR|nr:hypothetical protein IW261DRAFT_1441209 [Armillaria novae-zelandiae]
MAILGQPLFLQLDLLFFPGPDKVNNYVMFEKGGELAAKLQGMRHARPSNVRRPCTHPCTITNNVNAKSLTLQPLIGSADEGLYMRRSDVEKLGLEFTGRQIDTRQGKCKVYKGASYRFQNDYNGSAVTYHAPYVLELESWVTKTLHAGASVNTKKEGIVGVPQLDRHLVFFSSRRCAHGRPIDPLISGGVFHQPYAFVQLALCCKSGPFGGRNSECRIICGLFHLFFYRARISSKDVRRIPPNSPGLCDERH